MSKKIIDDNFISRLESVSYNVKTLMKGYFGGNHKAPSYGSTVEFADFREYIPGDDIRRIDWNLFCRFEKYFIRLFVDERQLHTQIFLDCSASMEGATPEKGETALKTAAALGYLSVQEMDRVSFRLINGNESNDVCQTIMGKEALYGALSRLGEATFSGTADLEKAVCKCQNPGYDDGMTIIISDFLTESNWKKAVDFLLYRHREVLLIQILTPEEINPGYNGRIQLIDCESTDQQDARNMKMKITRNSYKAYREALKEYMDDLKHFCLSRNVGYILLDTSQPIEQQLFKKLYEKEVIQ